MSQPFTIGVLGGMGPRATVEFEQRLIDSLEGSDQEMPRIITVNDGSIWDRTEYLIGQGNDPLEQLIPGARLLRKAGVDVVCLPCNTAHAGGILARLQAVVPLPVIDMPAACVARALSLDVKRLLVIGTEGTRSASVYQSRAGRAEVCALDDQQQVSATKLIAVIKSGQSIDRQLLQSLVETIEGNGCDGVVLACTELSLVKEELETMVGENIKIIDSVDELVRRCKVLYNEQKEYIYDAR